MGGERKGDERSDARAAGGRLTKEIAITATEQTIISACGGYFDSGAHPKTKQRTRGDEVDDQASSHTNRMEVGTTSTRVTNVRTWLVLWEAEFA